MNFNEAWIDTCSTVGLAAKSGNLDELFNLINTGFSVDVPDNRGWRPIHEAAAASNTVKCLELLLKHPRTNVNWVTHEGETALLLACKHRTRHAKEAVNMLLHFGAKPNISDSDQDTPILVATKKGDLAVVNTLIKANADVNVKDCSGWTPLHEAAKDGRLDILKKLLCADAKIESQDECGLTPIIVAAQNRSIECLKTLLKTARRRGQPEIVNLGAEDGASPLMLAAQLGYKDCVQLLIDYGADVNQQAADQNTALHSAVQGEHVDVLKILMSKMDLQPLLRAHHPQYEPWLLPSKMLPLVHLAVEWQSIECLKTLLEAGFSPDSVMVVEDVPMRPVLGMEPPFLDSALSFAICHKDQTSATILLTAGATPDVPHKNALHPLVNAILCQDPLMLNTLLEFGSNVNYCSQLTYRTNTILVVALMCHQWGLSVTTLLRCGSNPLLCFKNFESISVFYNKIALTSTSTSFAWKMMTLLQFMVVESSVQNAYHTIEDKVKQASKHDAFIWSDINSIIDQPSSLKHMCRMSIRHQMFKCHGPHLKNRLSSLPLPSVLIQYLRFDSLSSNPKYRSVPSHYCASFYSDIFDESMSQGYDEENINYNEPI